VAFGPVIVAGVLAAAVLHASWNAVAKATEDRLGLFAKSSAVRPTPWHAADDRHGLPGTPVTVSK
jgi:hypothetical protein